MNAGWHGGTIMSMNRRQALSLMAAVPIGMGVASVAEAAAHAGAAAFEHGVASGDPSTDGAVLWTRVSGATGATPVAWEVAKDRHFKSIVRRDALRTGPERDYTVKAEIAGLKPGCDYWYRFTCGKARSAAGRTRTLPVGKVDSLNFAVVTCSLYPAGYFNAYDHIAKSARLDAVIELGDYIYEYGAKPGDYGADAGAKLGRAHEPPHDIVTLADYRTRHAQYKRDPDLQAAHAAAPWICIWDDHETANDSWVGGAENHHPDKQGAWLQRETAALRAYFEWMPIREPKPGRAIEAINRSFQFGDLASLIMLESRLTARSYQLEFDRSGDIPYTVYDSKDWRTRKPLANAALAEKILADAKAGKAPPNPYSIGPDVAAVETYIANPERQMLGVRQEQWLAQEVAASVAAGKRWQVIGNQVIMAKMINPNVHLALPADAIAAALDKLPPESRAATEQVLDLLTYPIPFDLDAWNGYPAARERTYRALASAPAANPIVLSGDSHAFWVNALHDAAGARVAAEFGTSSITSPSPGDEYGLQLGDVFTGQNKEVLFCDQRAKGYVLLTLTPAEARAQLIAVTPHEKPYTAETLATYLLAPATGEGPGALKRV
jgi:alkaline phosphatase D